MALGERAPRGFLLQLPEENLVCFDRPSVREFFALGYLLERRPLWVHSQDRQGPMEPGTLR